MQKKSDRRFFQLVIVAAVLSGIGTLEFYILSQQDINFLFERESSTWLGFAGFFMTCVYAETGIFLGIILWELKYAIICSSHKINVKKG